MESLLSLMVATLRGLIGRSVWQINKFLLTVHS